MKKHKRNVAFKSWGNARAFIILEDRQISVHGRLYTSNNEFRYGPHVIIGEIPNDTIFNEIHQRKCMCDAKSKELEAYINNVWKQAKQKQSWFNYPL